MANSLSSSAHPSTWLLHSDQQLTNAFSSKAGVKKPFNSSLAAVLHSIIHCNQPNIDGADIIVSSPLFTVAVSLLILFSNGFEDLCSYLWCSVDNSSCSVFIMCIYESVPCFLLHFSLLIRINVNLNTFPLPFMPYRCLSLTNFVFCYFYFLFNT